MMRYVEKSRNRPSVWCAAIVVLSALVGFWNAEEPRSAAGDTQTRDERSTSIEQIESTLAQAGCPGWMVLASEGEAALASPSEMVPDGVVKQTAHRVTTEVPETHVPKVAYPAPVRVASRFLFAPPAGSKAQLTSTAADDPNDLLDGVPDLLIGTDTEQPTAIETPADESTPADEPPAESNDTAPDTSFPDAAPEEESPEEESPAVPADETPIFPGPALPSGQSAPRQDAPRARSTTPRAGSQLPEPQRPTQPNQSEPIELPRAFEGPDRVQHPPARQPNQSTERSPVRPTAPQVSPFSAPPKPTQPTPHSTGGEQTTAKKKAGETKTYCEFVAESQYPSAQACAKCHEKIFDEWSVSSHAYAMVSPMFHKFEQTINNLSQSTVGYFCYRCHSPVGVTLGISRAAPLWDLPQVAREGVTCIACHRVNQRYGKVNGHRRIEPGSIHDPVYGSIGGDGIAEVIAQKSKYKVKTSPDEKGPGQDIHVAGQCFDQLSKAEFCVSCHQVAVHPGIKLEVVWEQYRASPACKKGVSCQDCHMGRIPGVKSGYEYGAAAKVNDKVVNPKRKHANHEFYGPGYSIAHPGVFPHNIDANRWSMQEWLLFDWRAGWGTEDFEELVDEGRIRVNFPKVWAEADDRYDAREIIEDNQKKIAAKKINRAQVMENGSHVDGPFFDTQLTRGQDLKFHYVMTNTNEGHNLPSGSLGAQPQLWANVVLVGPRGQRLWESGYTDRYGDVADIHSEDVRNKLIPFDWQLFNLQTMFLITGAKGTDREFYLPVNFDFDQLPYLRPGAQPISVLNHPPFIRMEGRSLPALGSRKIPYKVPAELIQEPGHYRLSFRLRSRLEPIYFMRFCGSTQEMIRSMNEGMLDFHQSSVEFFVR